MLKNLYLICGKSGSGKNYVVEKLHEMYGYKVLCSYTTREPRYESDNEHIYKKFFNYLHDKQDDLIATDTYFDGNFYWARKEQLNTSDLYIIDKKGIEKLKELKYIRPFIVIYIDLDEDKRIENMKKRGDDNMAIYKRLTNDKDMFNGIEQLADFIVNGDNDNKWRTIKNIIDKCEKIEN